MTAPLVERPFWIPTNCEVAGHAALLGSLSRAALGSRDAAVKTYRLFRDNPKHPSLHLKRIHARDPVFSVRVTLGFRAVGLLESDEVTWFWIGSHADYDRLLKML